MEITQILPDKWDGASGSYQGKDLFILPFLLDIYEVSDKLLMTTLILDIIRESSDITNESISKRAAKHGK